MVVAAETVGIFISAECELIELIIDQWSSWIKPGLMLMTEKFVLGWKGTQLPVEHLVVLGTVWYCVYNPHIITFFLAGGHLEKVCS